MIQLSSVLRWRCFSNMDAMTGPVQAIKRSYSIINWCLRGSKGNQHQNKASVRLIEQLITKAIVMAASGHGSLFTAPHDETETS